jgi:DnaK suppressor protein
MPQFAAASPMFDDASLSSFRERLLQKQQELQSLDETSSDAARTVELDQTRVGRLSRMDALQGQAVSLELRRRRQAELQRISKALRRLDGGEFGYCEHCGVPIAVKRLEFDPAVDLCIDCASSLESGEPR